MNRIDYADALEQVYEAGFAINRASVALQGHPFHAAIDAIWPLWFHVELGLEEYAYANGYAPASAWDPYRGYYPHRLLAWGTTPVPRRWIAKEVQP